MARHTESSLKDGSDLGSDASEFVLSPESTALARCWPGNQGMPASGSPPTRPMPWPQVWSSGRPGSERPYAP